MLRLDTIGIPQAFWFGLAAYTIAGLLVRLFVFRRFGLYSRFWRYASIDELVQIGTAVLVSTFLLTLLILIARSDITPLHLRDRSSSSTPCWSSWPLVACASVYASWKVRRYQPMEGSRRALIMGAGSAGETVARELQKTPESRMIPFGFLDDDPQKLHMHIHGLPVLGGRKDIPRVAARNNIDLLDHRYAHCFWGCHS